MKRMKRIILMVVMTMVLCGQGIADTYHDVFAQYMQRGNVIDKGMYEQTMRPVIEQLFPAESDQVAAVFREYAASQLMTDIVVIYEPTFRQYVSEDELNELVGIYSDPRFAALEARSAELLANMTNTDEYNAFIAQFQQAAVAIVSGQPVPADIAVPASIPAEYANVFRRYYTSSRTEATLMTTFNSMFDMLANMLRQNGVANPEEKINALVYYANRNLPNTMMTLFYRVMSVEDLQLAIGLTERPSYNHSMEALLAVSSNTAQIAAELYSNMADWMETHYPQYATPIRQLAVELSKTK